MEMVERHLENWANWHKRSSANLGYPKRAMVAVCGGQSIAGVFEEMCEDADRCAAEIMEALVNDLAIDQKSAVHHRWLGCVIRVRDQGKSLHSAYDSLIIKMRVRGLV